MDHLQEAEKSLETFYQLSPAAIETKLALMAAQAHALIAIGYALSTLADCCTGDGEHIGKLHISIDSTPGIYR